MRNLPTSFHLRALWTGITALSITVTVGIVIGFIYLGTQVIAFLQPILIPFAVAGVLAYLLEPVVARLVKWGMGRQRAVLLVFSVVSAIFVGIALPVGFTLVKQGLQFASELDDYAGQAGKKISGLVTQWHDSIKKHTGIEILDFINPSGKKERDAAAEKKAAAAGNASPGNTSTPSPETAPAPPVTVPALPVTPPVSEPPTPATDGATTTPPAVTDKPASDQATAPAAHVSGEVKQALEAEGLDVNSVLNGDWLKDAVTQLIPSIWSLVRRSLGGFMGVFGFLLSFVIVPLYLYYFLTETAVIKKNWSNYVPLRASVFKDEVVATLTEINRYLIAFFRGQLLVSLVNGLATGLGLVIVGLKFGWLIGLSLCLLGMIPYVGIILCMIPAVIIATVQGSCWLLPASSDPWGFPVLVLAIFIVVQQIDSWLVSPKIVGESVGFHPMTVIMSVFFWSLVLGGLLGAILAVPLTAAVKVLFQRYIWHRRILPAAEAAGFADTRPLETSSP